MLAAVIAAGLLGIVRPANLAEAQETVSAGSGGSSGDESFATGDNPDGSPENFSDGSRYRPLPSYTNCGPWYNSYQNFVRAMMSHVAARAHWRTSAARAVQVAEWCQATQGLGRTVGQRRLRPADRRA